MIMARKVDTILTNLQAVLPDRVLTDAILTLKDGMISDIFLAKEFSIENSPLGEGPVIIDLGGDFIIPGLIDLHVHGCGGSDTMDANFISLDNMATSLLQQGTTAFLATTMTAPVTLLQSVLAAGEVFCSTDHQSEFIGFHMEGPCISPDFRGAQKLSEQSDFPVSVTSRVKILTLAPEMPAARKIMEMETSAAVILSAGHSGASYEQMQEAIAAGVCYVTHAFNAMPGIHHRAPGLLSAALLDPRVTIELIADGIHVHPAVLELALRLKGIERVVLVSDGTRAVGMPDGVYDLGGQKVQLYQGKMTLPNGTIAGSSKSLLAGICFLTEVVGRPLYQSVRMATLNPARLMQVDHCYGSLEPGKTATFLRLTPDLKLREVWVKGCCRYSAQK